MKILVRGIGIAIFAVIAVFGCLWLDHRRETQLPPPTGSFQVARTTLLWVDPLHTDSMAPQPGAIRELFAWVWYPTMPEPSRKMCDYLPTPWRQAIEHQMGVLLTNFVTRDLSKVHTNSYCDGAVSTTQASYPVILMRAGLAAEISNYSTLAEDLASHGYIVVGFDAPYRTSVVVLPDGAVILRAPQNNADLLTGAAKDLLADRLAQAWSGDLGFALDELNDLNSHDPAGRFTGHLDLEKVGVFGHSLGGATTLRFCHRDRRCKAGVDLDGAPIGNPADQRVTQPFLFLLSDHSGEPTEETAPVEENIRSIFDAVPAGSRWEIEIRGAQHFGFSDPVKSPLFLGILRTIGVLHISQLRQIAVTDHYLCAFFDTYLKGLPDKGLHSQPEYPEAEYIQ